MAQSWLVDPSTGDYVMEKGVPKETDSLTMAAYFRLKVKRNEWLYAPSSDYGSTFSQLKKRKSSQDLTGVENIAAQALQPIVDDGRASNIDVQATLSTRNNVGMDVTVTDARGNLEQIAIPGLGV